MVEKNTAQTSEFKAEKKTVTKIVTKSSQVKVKRTKKPTVSAMLGKDASKSISATGRRKVAHAHVWIASGDGKFFVNGKPLNEYFVVERNQKFALESLELLKKTKSFNFYAKVGGGGLSAQAQAVRHAIARCLVENNHEDKKALKSNNMLTRDSRMVESKKSGYRKARKKEQFSKR